MSLILEKGLVVLKILESVVVTQVPLHEIRLSQRELHQMKVPDVKVETQNASREALLWSSRLRRR